MRSKVIWTLVCLILVAGMGLSYQDYKQWRVLEVGKFGQGSAAEAELSPAKNLGLPYSAYVGNFRIKAPMGWVATENLTLKNMHPGPVLPKQKLAEIVRFKDPASEAQMVISGMRTDEDLTTLAKTLDQGITRDREYFNTDNLSITVLTWDGPQQVVQKAMFLTNGSLVVIEASAGVSAWKTWERTFAASYLSAIRI